MMCFIKGLLESKDAPPRQSPAGRV
ncbi:hypothetical protein EMIT051CA3_60026 [Pseudomonas chlororaphis]